MADMAEELCPGSSETPIPLQFEQAMYRLLPLRFIHYATEAKLSELQQTRRLSEQYLRTVSYF